ncbi:CAP domain-containing protein [Lentibacillus salinarum]|uniref:CAP domain-containing protein n=1 Tax=Lentibacillus salinarum TaxID=446820 RepID=A0ABW3ZRU4_9BACI
MFNKLMTGSLTAALLFGGAWQTTADASANVDKSQNQSHQYNVHYSINGSDWTELSSDRFSNLHKYFPQINWNSDKQQHDGEQKAESKQEKPDQNQQQPENQNTSEQKQDQSEQQGDSEQKTDKQEQPAEQPEAQAPQQPAEQQQEQQSQSQSQQLSEFEQQVVELTNEERTAQGLDPLKIDTELSKVAREKSRDMAYSNYFSHDSPTYGSPFDMMKDFGISYQTAGENIARGQRTPEQVVNGWMNSDGHRENIMNPNFTHIGVGYVEQGNHWTQQFIGK